jgi:protein arginine kinase
MAYGELLAKDSFWMQDVGLPIVLSTRIRLARNLAGVSFPHAMSEEEAGRVEARIADCLKDFTVEGEKMVYLPLPGLTPVERKVLVEKHLISPVFSEAGAARGVVLSESHKVSVW